MDSATYPPVTMARPTAAASEQALDEARRLFVHTLAGWTSDLLALHRNGAERATWSGPERDRDSWSKAA